MADTENNSKVLSQSEVDTLLNAVKEGDVTTEMNAGNGANLQAYDFRKRRKLVRARLPGLKIIHDRFQRIFRQTLSSLVRKNVIVETAQSEPARYGEWISSIPARSCLTISRLSPLIGQSIVNIDPKFVFTLIDNIFGGGKSGKEIQKNEGDFTTIELKMIQKLVAYFTNDLTKAWSTIFELEFDFVRTETNPEYVSIVAPSDVVIVTDFGIQFEGVKSTMQMVMPLFALDPIKHLLSDHTYVEQTQPNPNWKLWIADSLKQSKVNMRCVLGGSEITMRDVLSLKAGDTIQLERYANELLPVDVEGKKKFLGKMGVSCGQQAIQVAALSREMILKK